MEDIAMKFKLKVYPIWEQGQRGNQEDSIFPELGRESSSDRLFVLCDGMGGHEAGEKASQTVCQAISGYVNKECIDSEGEFSEDDMNAAIESAFNALDELLSDDVPQNKKMGTTMTCLKLHGRGCTIAHMGDSRVYHIRPGEDKDRTQILFRTSDHSLVNDLIKIGELTEEEAKQSGQKNVITRAMQPRMERRPKADIYESNDIKAGDYFYLCSDGMLEEQDDDNLRFLFSQFRNDAYDLKDALRKATGNNQDNHSAFIVYIEEVYDEADKEKTVIEKSNEDEVPVLEKYDEKNNCMTEENQVAEVKQTDDSGKDLPEVPADVPASSNVKLTNLFKHVLSKLISLIKNNKQQEVVPDTDKG